MTSVELDPRFMRTFRSTWEDTPSSHAVPHSMLTALGLTRGDYLDVKAWIFLVARKLQFENGERAAFKFSQQATALDILDFLHIAGLEYVTKQFFSVQEELLLDRETCCRLLAFLHCNSLIDCRLLALSVFIFSYSRQPVMLRAALREILISLLGPDIISLAEPILAALKPRLLDDINDPRLALRAYLVVMQLAQLS
ncbi:hypothetical protein, conserved [Eimeria acervulina]|uniref:Uncharacterized protein n=1 Tax=Eimeria acervulina TaxID=5801 RepID=U6GDA0_EIMAC|nr:hypothetical protein, conserved [Eimeria acervulina]CDI78115.1 hypothetical protein, conserved [Eimeria acervulina]